MDNTIKKELERRRKLELGMNPVIIYFVAKYKNDWKKTFKAFESKEYISLEALETIAKWLKDNDGKVITVIDKDYPEKCQLMEYPPFALFAEKDIVRSLFNVFSNIENKEAKDLNIPIMEIDLSKETVH